VPPYYARKDEFMGRPEEIASFEEGCDQGCQIFVGPNVPNWEKYS
jgi:hypothetical protein